MKTDKVVSLQTQKQTYPILQGYDFTADELKRLTDFFSILIEIDQKQKAKLKSIETQLITQKQ